MKQISISLPVLLLASATAFGQTFQNTFQPANDDNYVAGVNVNNHYWVAGNTSSFAPALGTEHILFSKYNGTTGVVIWDRKYYDGADKTIQFTATDIQAGYAVLTPSPGNSTPALPCSFNACPVAGTNTNEISQPDSKNYFYITGFYKDPVFGVRRPVVMKLNVNGGILWVRTNFAAGPVLEDEAGVSVESCPNGDVIAVSVVTTAAGEVYPAATRIDINGNLLWRYRYMRGVGEPNYNFNPRQSCIFKETVPGSNSTAIGLAITGECTDPALPGSSFFVMRIAYNGGMIWKYNYPLATPTPVPGNDIGWDIMLEDDQVGPAITADNFIVTGLTNSAAINPTPGAAGFVSRVNTVNGGFVNLYRYWVTGANATGFMYGQGIYQATSAAQNVVVTGGVNEDSLSNIINDTYLIEMNVLNGTINWANHFPLTTPNYSRTESVVSAAGNIPTPGYFISTNSFDTYGGGTLTDGHVIKTDLIGQVNAFNCPSDTMKLSWDSLKANIITRCTEQKCDSIEKKALTMKKVTAPHVLCYSPVRMEESSAEVEWDGDLSVFPNPASGEFVQVFMTNDGESEYELAIFNIQGQVMRRETGLTKEGDQQITVSIAGLPDGIYSILLTAGEQIRTSRLIVSR